MEYADNACFMTDLLGWTRNETSLARSSCPQKEVLKELQAARRRIYISFFSRGQ